MMHSFSNKSDGEARKPYSKPQLEVVELALEETLSAGCKLGTDFECVGPPEPVFDGGS